MGASWPRLAIDHLNGEVVAQTGRYAPAANNVTQANKFVVEGEKRYWLYPPPSRSRGTTARQAWRLTASPAR